MAIDKLQKDALSNTVTANIASLTVGANVSINSSACGVGSGRIVAGGITLPSNFGVSSNTTNLLENRGGQLFFNGRRVDLVKSVYGYALGGFARPAGTTVTTTQRITFSTGVFSASTISNLSVARMTTGVSDTSVYGYTMGGYSGPYLATTDRTAFSTSITTASTISNLSVARQDAFGLSDGAIYGYGLGGSSGTKMTTTDRITFSTSITAASTISNLAAARFYHNCVSDGSIYGYTYGGETTTGMIASTDRTTFSTSATAAYTVGNLVSARRSQMTLSDNVTYGYNLGGDSSGNFTAFYTNTERTTFSTGISATSTISNLSQGRAIGTSNISDGTLYGYVSGGYIGSSANVVTTDRVTFSTSITAAYTTGNLPVATDGVTGFSDGAV